MTSTPLAGRWLGELRPRLARYAAVAAENIRTEFPSHVSSMMTGPGDFPHRPSDRNPVFYGSLDWHSCVEMHWVLVRLLKTAPDGIPEPETRRLLDAQFTPGGLRAEAAFIGGPGAMMERPYGWGWALALARELQTWDDPDARRWSALFQPVAAAVEENFRAWLPKATYPDRTGLHKNSAFGLSLALPYADAHGLGGPLRAAANRWYREDTDYPGRYEPSGSDFLSAALCEAELMARVLPSDDFPAWLGEFLPGLADGDPESLFTPAVVSDPSDGYLAHLAGLNLSRVWCWRRLAETLPDGDPRLPACERAMRVHAEASLDRVAGDDYMVGHWLVAYAVLLLTP